MGSLGQRIKQLLSRLHLASHFRVRPKQHLEFGPGFMFHRFPRHIGMGQNSSREIRVCGTLGIFKPAIALLGKAVGVRDLPEIRAITQVEAADNLPKILGELRKCRDHHLRSMRHDHLVVVNVEVQKLTPSVMGLPGPCGNHGIGGLANCGSSTRPSIDPGGNHGVDGLSNQK